MKERFSEEQIVGFLREAERGAAVKDKEVTDVPGLDPPSPLALRWLNDS